MEKLRDAAAQWLFISRNFVTQAQWLFIISRNFVTQHNEYFTENTEKLSDAGGPVRLLHRRRRLRLGPRRNVEKASSRTKAHAHTNPHLGRQGSENIYILGGGADTDTAICVLARRCSIRPFWGPQEELVTACPQPP